MASATAAAGKSASSKVTLNSYVPQMNLWRSFIKTITIRPSPTRWGGPSRNGRMFVKSACWLMAFSFPNWLLNKYGLPELYARHFGNGDPRWLHATSTGVANISQRALPWDPHGLVTPDPWTTFVPRMNEIYAEPWEQLSRQDHVEESEAWSKFGEPANRTQGAFGSTSQKQSLQFIFMSLDEETSFAKFYAKTFLTSLKMWGSDVYYSYWGCFFDVPLDERYESLGQSYGRRIVKRWYAGQGLSGYKNIKWYDGGLILPTSDNTQW
eukprot:TRINITY_DN809_c2_g1_i1.p1 TRINITY_DN809_c2_g1~~TRINITY_DN809_c2_g1_i1.p1  ORF type:complete len:285 (+),score=44.60 TRINITY_DN809_c2_g1_i1:57-857(+)